MPAPDWSWKYLFFLLVIQYFGAAITGPANRVTQPRAAAEYCARRGLDMQEGGFWA